MKYSNNLNISPIVGAWLMADDYDGYDTNAISATGLMRPIREIILKGRLMRGEIEILGQTVIPLPTDISALIRARIGQAIHSSLEQVWLSGKGPELTALFNQEEAGTLAQLAVNPADGSPTEKSIFVEKRITKELAPGIRVTGKYDIVVQGTLNDYKTGSAFLYKRDKTEDYVFQGSVYRMLAPETITSDFANFHELYLDWSPKTAQLREDYPPAPVITKQVLLMPIEETHKVVMDRIALIQEHQDTDESLLPHCTDSELWVGPTEYKYYKKADQTRATKNFGTDSNAAYAYLQEQNGVGFIKQILGEAKRCNYCPVFQVCSQKDQLIAEGRLSV